MVGFMVVGETTLAAAAADVVLSLRTLTLANVASSEGPRGVRDACPDDRGEPPSIMLFCFLYQFLFCVLWFCYFILSWFKDNLPIFCFTC